MKFSSTRWVRLVLVGFLSAASAAESGSDAANFFDPIPRNSSTTEPEGIRDEYWRGQFERINREVASARDCQLVFFGDSITKGWTLLQARGAAVWEKRFARYAPINMGNSGDITPVMLFRARHGNLDFPEGCEPRVAVLLCGTNNFVVEQSDGGRVKWDLGMSTPPAEVAEGVRAVARAFRRELPMTRVILLGILPVANEEKAPRVRAVNRLLGGVRYPEDEVVFLDLADRFSNADGSLKKDLYTDGTHLTAKGYEVMAEALMPEIERLMALEPITNGASLEAKRVEEIRKEVRRREQTVRELQAFVEMEQAKVEENPSYDTSFLFEAQEEQRQLREANEADEARLREIDAEPSS